LQDAGCSGPGNCSGSLWRWVGDPSFFTDFTDQGGIGLPAHWVHVLQQLMNHCQTYKGEDALRRAWEAGASHVGVIIRRILPGVGKYLVVLAPLAMTYAIVLESVMSYLGIGLPRPTPSWGLMVADGRAYQTTGWWLSGFPALAIHLVVSGGSLLAMRLGEQLNLR
jgi:peptide/nickel transport system permease protein